MPNRIEVALKDGVRDARGERIKREIEHFLHLRVQQVRTIDIFTVDAELSATSWRLQQAVDSATRSSRAGALICPRRSALTGQWEVELPPRP